METDAQTIEELRERYEQLNTRAIRAQTQLETAEDRLAALRKQAKAEYGTADLAELEKKLEEMRSENETKRAEYQKALDGIENKLEAIETEYGSEEV